MKADGQKSPHRIFHSPACEFLEYYTIDFELMQVFFRNFFQMNATEITLNATEITVELGFQQHGLLSNDISAVKTKVYAVKTTV